MVQEKPDKNWKPSPAETDDFSELLECFQRNFAGSVCPNIAKGNIRYFRSSKGSPQMSLKIDAILKLVINCSFTESLRSLVHDHGSF